VEELNGRVGDGGMTFSVLAGEVQDILRWRDLYRAEMNCQIVHDSLHSRAGWTIPYLLQSAGTMVGYGSIAIGGPWKGKPTVFEFYVLPQYCARVFELFDALLEASGAVGIEVQSNDPLLTVMLHAFAREIVSESIVFHDRLTTTLAPPAGAIFRRMAAEDSAGIAAAKLDSSADWLVEMDGAIAATGGILFHYNRPYGDIYMAVAEGFRRRGLGSYLVQELKRVCFEGGNVPACRCNVGNVASRRTLAKAGFVPCGAILVGAVSQRRSAEKT
jgi:GNAT superfamily N-acetyltransferase